VRKLRSISCNLDTLENNTNINKKDVYQKEEIVCKKEKPTETEKSQLSTREEHHPKRENIAEEVGQGLEMLEEQMKGLSITSLQHQLSQTANENRTIASKVSQKITGNIEDTDMELEEQEEEPTKEETEVPFPTSTIEQSRWSPENRICDRDKSFKANMPTYALTGKGKEERIKYVQWIIGNNHHIKTVKEVFKNENN